MVMMNVLKTIEQLVSSVRDKKDLVAQIETMIVPLLEATIRQNVIGTCISRDHLCPIHGAHELERLLGRTIRRNVRGARLDLVLPTVRVAGALGLLRSDVPSVQERHS